jgi:hypothetical protein
MISPIIHNFTTDFDRRRNGIFSPYNLAKPFALHQFANKENSGSCA